MGLFFIGLFSGVFSGMGVGGGMLLIIIISIFINPGQQIAQSMNLIYFIPTAIAALITHIKNKDIDFKVAIYLIVFGFVGSYFGSKLAAGIDKLLLRRIFAVFLLVIIITGLLKKDYGCNTEIGK